MADSNPAGALAIFQEIYANPSWPTLSRGHISTTMNLAVCHLWLHHHAQALSFYQLNGDRGLAYGKRIPEGGKEREEILLARMQNLAIRIEADPPRGATRANLLDAYATLWTARRIAARAVTRIPDSPEWNGDGLRMEVTY